MSKNGLSMTIEIFKYVENKNFYVLENVPFFNLKLSQLKRSRDVKGMNTVSEFESAMEMLERERFGVLDLDSNMLSVDQFVG